MVTGKVVENRGRVGVRGRKLYRVVITSGMPEPMSIELPEAELTISRRAAKTRVDRRARAKQSP
jgi:hypothetical protein